MKQYRSSLISIIVVTMLVLVGWSSAAWAAGFYLPGRGVKPMGRAGALVASGEGDLNSLWYNPANLYGFDGLRLTVDASLIDLSLHHQRAPRRMPNGEVRYYEAIENEAWPEVIPQILIGGKTASNKLFWGAGFYTPYLSSLTFPEHGPQRYVLVDNKGSVIGYLHAAIGYEITDWLRVGVGLQNFIAHFRIVTMASAYVGIYGDPEDEDLDILTEVIIGDYFNPTANFGLWAELSPGLEAAFSLQLPNSVRDKNASIDVRLPSHPSFDNSYLSHDSADIGLSFPLIARLGLRYTQPEQFDIEVAAVYEGWSVFDTVEAVPNDIYLEDMPGIGAVELGPVIIPQNSRDAFSIRLGGDYHINKSATIRAGYAYETGSVPDETANVLFFDNDKQMFAVGGSFLWNDLLFDFGAAYFLIPDRTITNSKVRQINPADTDNELSLIVGNGFYRTRFINIGAGITYQF